ncbi:MAG: hypothetical protein IT307_16330 [Chloroflexi bacterium]|nr:hypothetical protein [Chloroflexota bacterium]
MTHRLGPSGARRLATRLLGGGLLLYVVALAAPASFAQQPPPAPPLDPDQLKSQLSQSLARLVLDRPVSLAQRAHAIAAEDLVLAQDLTPRLQAGQGPNGGPVPLGLDIEVGQLAAEAAACAAEADRNVKGANQDLDVLKDVLGGQLDMDGDPGPERSMRILNWLATTVQVNRARNAAIEQCVEMSMLGLGRLRAYRSLYAA